MRYLWCQRDVAPIGERFKACARPVNHEPNFMSLGYCEKHLSRLPFWPHQVEFEVINKP